ncbi:site-specific recombinase [Granulicella aggregans]|uniref:Site-specific recombinase n=2 Tax=Granulicella aggregans TaxID=474949 RepID=A0A7W7ZDA0_9BACT|nr:site-specific recombinase [Granulicella aggregans]
MAMLRTFRKMLRSRRFKARPTFVLAHDELYRLTQGFCEADTTAVAIRRASTLFGFIWGTGSDRAFVVRLLRWIRMMEQDRELSAAFSRSWNAMLLELDSVTLFAEAGLPGHHALVRELVGRVFQRLLPSAREESDTGRIFADVFSTPEAVERFVGQQGFVFERLVRVLALSPAAVVHLEEDLRQAMCLLATRVAGRGATAAIRQRGSTRHVEESPFYLLIFATERMMRAEGTLERREEFGMLQGAIAACIGELDQIHLHMEDAGVSSALVYDLRSIEGSLVRMDMLAAVYTGASARVHSPLRELMNTLVRGRLDDMRLRLLIGQNVNMLARKTVERTGQGGEHYIAHSDGAYWRMWRAAAGGGLLTVFTAAVKMRLIESHFPLAIEGFFIGTDYAVSFILLQIFGLALATKQPSMTAATLAGIIRENRGVARFSKISEFAADISRTQLAAAFSNVIAVCVGAVAFERLWDWMFKAHYLAEESAHHVTTTLHPFTSGTAIFAAFTGVLLWMAAVIGGWFENFAVYHRVPEAVAQHPLGQRFGTRKMKLAADWLERNLASWSTSIVLGYLLGFSPVVARFFGIPLDVRHVTLSTGTLALAAARFGTSSFGHGWLWYAIAGIGITFVLNLGVSFSIASLVALRAYEVPREEQWQIVKFLAREVLDAPLSFVFPVREEVLSIAPVVDEEVEETVPAEH